MDKDLLFAINQLQAEKDELVDKVKKLEAKLAEVERLRKDCDAMVEEAADSLNASIKMTLMDEMHDHALTIDKLTRCVKAAQTSPMVAYTPLDGEVIHCVPVSVILEAGK